ncbi:MAG: DUF3883 domain-containing protein [Caldilineaceae bacterium]|nr:DUF3883 domain-containing protein [Caldilineaceae bacterium]
MTIAQSSGIYSELELTLRRLNYPSRLERKDLWIRPRAPIGISEAESEYIEIVYWEGLPRSVIGCGVQPEIVLEYITGPAFSQPPPVALVVDSAGNIETFRQEGNQFHAAGTVPDWEETLAEPPGHISSSQAVRVIQEVSEDKQEWFQNPLSKKVVGVLPRIFPEGTVALYELLQNAADSGASRAAFRLDSDTLLFLHDGYPFTENDVDAISFVNSSTKPVGTIGFMGIGFKAAFEISDQPEIQSPPFCFCFDSRQEGGELFPIPIDCSHTSSEGFSTTFRFPLKAESRNLIVDELARFDGHPLLYIGANLRRITTPNDDFELRQARTVGEVQLLEISELKSNSRTEYAVFSRELELSPAALEEFAQDRKLDLSQWEGRMQRVSIAIPLANGLPDANHSGRLQVYLPTEVRLPVAFDVQGNFLVGASRKELRHASGPWNREHFRTLPLLVADLLEWAKEQAPDASNWADWYDFIPDWQELEEDIGLRAVDGDEENSKIDLRSAFATELAKRKLIPAIDNEGTLIFVAPEDAVSVEQDLREVLSEKELSRLSGLGVISPDLSKLANEKLAAFIEEFSPDDFRDSLEDSEWADSIEAFSHGVQTRRGRRQLAKVLAYLERSWHSYLDNFFECTVILTQTGELRAALEEHNDRQVHTLPDGTISFSEQELKEHYDVVHQKFRSELNRPSEMSLEPEITRDAVEALERVAPTLDAGTIASDIILPLFQGERWKEIPDERLIRYTGFLMQNNEGTKAAIGRSDFKVKVRGSSRLYLPPDQTYFGQGYTDNGHLLDRLCASAEGVHFISDDYLPQASRAKQDWTEFFSRLGVTDQPRVHTSPRQISEANLDELRRLTEEPDRNRISLRASYFRDIRAWHYTLDDFELDPPILETVQNLYRRKPTGWKDRLGCFAELVEAGWAQYGKKTYKILRYVRYYSSDIQREEVAALTTLGRFLRDEPWLPVVDDIRTTRRPSELVLNTEENIKLADKVTPLCYCDFENPDLIAFLEIMEHPPETTPLLRLQFAVERMEEDLGVFQELYLDLADAPDLDKKTLREEFRDNPLIYAPNHDPRYITSKEAVYNRRTRLAPRMAAIKDTYPDLEGFFTELLEIPTMESLEHCIEFLRDYVWEGRPPIADNLRSAIDSCYRKLLNHLNETEEEDRAEALASLKEKMGSSTMVFCVGHGWVNTTNTTVLYPDTPAYEGLLTDRPGIAVESHLKRLAQPTSEIRPLLDALNVRPISEAIRRVPEIGGEIPHSQSVEFGERLSLLVRKAVAIVEREQAQTESTSRNITLFLQEWREGSESLFRDVRFFETPLIKVRDELVVDGTYLREIQNGAFVMARADHLRIYMAGHLLDVFDAIADQLREILRLGLLPAGLRVEIVSLVQSNLARLDYQRFEDSLNQCLREKGFVVEEEEELRRIVQSATHVMEAAVQADPADHVQEPEPGTENPWSSTSVRGGGSSGANADEHKLPPKTLTPDEILEQLPEFDETSFGSDSALDLTNISNWRTPTQEPFWAGGSGGGSVGERNFRTVQAYRDAYGKRGEEWVVEWERRALVDAGKPDLAAQVLHTSVTHEGSPWDIESFEKSHPHRPIFVEVKSTTDPDSFEVDMSAEQIRAALRPLRPYYLYRVVNVHTRKPTVHIYDFKKISQLVQLSPTNVSVTLPRPEESEQ